MPGGYDLGAAGGRQALVAMSTEQCGLCMRTLLADQRLPSVPSQQRWQQSSGLSPWRSKGTR